MGYAPYYQAIPEQSDLFRQLQVDGKLVRLLECLFELGARPLDLDEAGQEDLDDTLEYLAFRESDTVFRSLEDAKQTLLKLRAGIEQANRLSPGLIERRAFIEKVQDKIEERLALELQRRGTTDAADLARSLISGERHLAGRFWLVSAGLVSQAASLFRGIEPDTLFDRVAEDCLYDDYRDWRDLYLHAADRGEAIIIL
jgi:hypothetical protein